MKSVSLISKLDNLTSTQFRDYYERTHCFKAMTFFPFRRYCRNYVLSARNDLDFDCISEFELDLGPDNGGDVMSSGSRAMVMEDERCFMKPERIRFAKVRERVLSESPEAVSRESFERSVLLFKREEQTPTEFEQGMEATARDVISRSPKPLKCSLDLVDPRAEGALPFDALLWLSFQGDASVPKLDRLPGLIAAISVDTHCSEADVLANRYGGYLP